MDANERGYEKGPAALARDGRAPLPWTLAGIYFFTGVILGTARLVLVPHWSG